MMKRYAGFSLMELMIAVAVVGILAAVAWPSYQAHLSKGRRAVAQTHLMDIAQRQQQYLLDARSYAPDLSTLSVTTPTDVSTYYTVTVASGDGPPPTFTVTATPIGGTSQANDGALTINQAGVKTPSDKW